MPTFLLYAALSLAQPTADSSFCARLATQADLVRTDRTASFTIWQKRIFGWKDILLGGTEAVVMKVGGPPDASPSEVDRIEDSCKVKGGATRCELSGPETFTMVFRERETTLAVNPGEKASVVVEGAHIRCEESVERPAGG